MNMMGFKPGLSGSKIILLIPYSTYCFNRKYVGYSW